MVNTPIRLDYFIEFKAGMLIKTIVLAFMFHCCGAKLGIYGR
jgi:hypothetical protein